MFKFKLYLNLTNFQKRDVWYSVRFHFMCSLALTFESDWRTTDRSVFLLKRTKITPLTQLFLIIHTYD